MSAAPEVYEVVVLALAIGAVAFTITRTTITKPLRTWLESKSSWLGKLFSCPYCLGHWLSFGAVVIYRPRLIELWYPLDLLVTAFVIVALAEWTAGLISKAMQV